MALDLTIFLLTSLAIILTPGQDLLMVMSRGVTQGASAGVVTALGVSTGLLGHTLLATFGVGALLLASDALFFVVKLLGAAYLLYLGFKLLLARESEIHAIACEPKPLWRCYLTGAVSNLTNPKVTLFYFAYLPQFIPTGHQNPYLLLMLGALFAALTFVVKAPIGYFAGRCSQWVLRHPLVLLRFNQLSGVVLISFGVKLAFARK